jgi:hypothetical protein
MIDFINAVIALYPSVVNGLDGKFFDKDGNVVLIDKSALQAYINANEYKQQRATEYPSITDQLDALWKGGDAAEEMLAKVQAVKTKYPKE